MLKITPTIKSIIEKNPVAFASVDKSNKPNVIGVACVKVVTDNYVLVTDNYMKKTKENIVANKNVCLAVWNKKWQGYKIVGQAKYFNSGKWKKFVETMKDNQGLPAKGAILIKINKLIKLG